MVGGLNSEISEGFLKEVTVGHGPTGNQGESRVYVLGVEGSKLGNNKVKG